VAFDRVFAAAYVNNSKSYRLLGVRVRPFCLWHLLLLQVIDSPFSRAGKVTLHDLKTAIGICRLRYRQSRVRRTFFPLFLGQKELKAEVERFLEYVGDYLYKPEYGIIPFDADTDRPQKPRRLPTPPPDIIMLAFDAAHGARISVPQAFEMPIGEAHIAQSMFLRMQGLQLDFMDEEERKFQKDMAEAMGM
jgi:hypothetical protein